MSTHRATVEWVLREGEDFAAGRYGRGHTTRFAEHTLPSTASRHVVGRWAAPGAVDPEEMLVAAISSCHMLSFLHCARLAGFVVARYRDAAEGALEPNAEGRLAVTRVMLRPQVDYAGGRPSEAETARLHHEAHAACFIANSVRTRIEVAPLAERD